MGGRKYVCVCVLSETWRNTVQSWQNRGCNVWKSKKQVFDWDVNSEQTGGVLLTCWLQISVLPFDSGLLSKNVWNLYSLRQDAVKHTLYNGLLNMRRVTHTHTHDWHNAMTGFTIGASLAFQVLYESSTEIITGGFWYVNTALNSMWLYWQIPLSTSINILINICHWWPWCCCCVPHAVNGVSLLFHW